MNKILKTYLISIAISLAVGGLSALFTLGNMDIYSQITIPPLSPPSALFPIVWTVLYFLMGISSAKIYRSLLRNPTDAKIGLLLYALQLIFNFFWSIFFFNFEAFTFSFFWLLALWFLIITMIVFFKKVSPAAAYLQIPYLLWVTFAAYLNLAIAILN